jgi:pimeloyl-ACP methyl ester carboxylesterase
LLDKIGAAIVIVHSQSGVMGLGAVIKRPKLIKGLISVEGGCEPVADADLPTYAKVPPNGGARRLGCQSTVAKFKNAGGKSPSQAKQLVVDIDRGQLQRGQDGQDQLVFLAGYASALIPCRRSG